MCLGIPGQVIRIDGEGTDDRTAEVDYGEGRRRRAHLLYLPEVRVGDWIVVQSGFATSRLQEADAREALAYLHDAAARPVGGTAGGA